MMPPENLGDIEIASQSQQVIQEAKHSRVVSQVILGQHEAIGNLDHAPTPNENSTMLSDSTPASNKRRYSWWQSIGPISASFLVIATLVILGSFFFLILLWQGAEDARNRKTLKLPNFWTMIVFRDWTARVITICSAAIRTSISLQISVLVSALAAIILETSGTSMMDIPSLSIERMQSNPMGILPAVLRQTVKSFSGAVHSFIIITSVIVLLVSNLTSTILLSDLGIAQIPGKPVVNDTVIFYNLSSPAIDTAVTSWTMKPSADWRFAETKLGESRFGDTGRVYRALLPFQDEIARTSLEYYSGPAAVANTRTICVPMSLDDFSIETKRFERRVRNGPTLWLREKDIYATYECAIHPSPGVDGFAWATTLCPGKTRHVEHQFLVDLEWNKTMLLENEEFQMTKIVILNTTAHIGALFENDTVFQPETPKRLQKLLTKVEGLWTKVYDTTGMEIMAATSCYYNIGKTGIYNVTMTGDAISKEPHWDSKDDYTTTHPTDWWGFWKEKTKETLSQFGIGVEPDDTAQRGILNLNIGPWADKANAHVPADLTYELPLEDILGERTIASNSTWDMSDDIASKPWAAHLSHALVFQNILKQTGDPALAVQSIFTRLHQSVYYSQMDTYDLVYPVTTLHLTKKLIPVQWVGLGLVIGMTVAHLILVFVIIVMFLSRTRLSALGNAWQAVAQATHATKALESAESDLDKDIGEWAKENGHDKDIYILSPSREFGQVEIRRRQRKG